jgi:hypothetical protein
MILSLIKINRLKNRNGRDISRFHLRHNLPGIPLLVAERIVVSSLLVWLVVAVVDIEP